MNWFLIRVLRLRYTEVAPALEDEVQLQPQVEVEVEHAYNPRVPWLACQRGIQPSPNRPSPLPPHPIARWCPHPSRRPRVSRSVSCSRLSQASRPPWPHRHPPIPSCSPRWPACPRTRTP